jgi:hypothetical protein
MGKKAKEPTQISIAKIGLIGIVIAAVIGLCGAIIAAYIGYLGVKAQIERPIHATQTAEILNLATEVVDGTQLPKSVAPGFSLSVEPGPFWLWVGLIKTPIDRNQLTQSIESDMVSMPDDTYSRFTSINEFPNTTHIILTGHSSDNLTYIPNRVPVKILSYQPVPETVDLQSMGIGGGDDVWLFSLDISSASTKMPNQITWASYSSDLQEQLSKRWKQIQTDKEQGIEYADPLLDAPTEIVKFASGESPTLPDYFQIKENEMMVFSVASLFKEPGIYTVLFGVEYVYNGYKNTAWADPPLIIFVPKNYYLWHISEFENTTAKMYLGAICKFTPNVGHTCEEVCQLWVDGLKCK